MSLIPASSSSLPVPPPQQPTFEDLELLVEVSQLLTLLELDQVMERVVDLAASAVGASRASLFLHDGQEVDWEHIFTARPLGAEQKLRVVQSVLDKGLAGWVVRNRVGTLVHDTATDDRWYVFPDDRLPVRSVLCVPLMYNDSVVAVLTLVHPEPNHFNEYQLRLMTIVANQASVSLRNAQLFSRLRAQQRQTELVLQSVPDMLFVLDAGGRVLLVNSGALNFVGLPREQAEGALLRDFAATRPDVFDRVLTIISETPERTRTWNFEVRQGDARDFAVNVSVWADEAMGRAGYVVLLHDITTLRNLSRFKDDMLKIVSHDLRSPLSLIAGYADLIELDADPDSPFHEYVGVIQRSVKRMGVQLEELLTVRGVGADQLNVEENVVLLDLVQQVAGDAEPLAGRKRQRLMVEFDLDDSVFADVDPILLRQAMANYASNAVKYTSEGGTVLLRAYVREGLFHWEVADNGMGIPAEYLPRVFDTFYRVPGEQVEAQAGSGLGLSLVKTIVERHRGEVWVESEEGLGSRFGLWVPLERATSA